ncbi:MAG: glycosyltransferase family 39 protein [Bacteroidales bacterium]|nr:glycosyltransferase family 39 protein [Bacteroidales bacterium]
MKINLQNTLRENTITFQKIFLFVVAIALYSNTLNHSWALDDTMMITENKFTKGGWEGLVKIFTTDAFAGYLGEGKTLLPGGRYRPLSQAVFNLYYSLFGLQPFGLHLISVLLFGLSALLLFKNLRDLFQSNNVALSIPFITSVLYIAHPIHTEVVANIKSLDLIFAMLFSMLSLHSALSYIRNQKIIHLISLAVFFFLGALSKETSLTFIAVIPLTLYFFDKPKTKDVAFVALALVVSTVAYFYVRWTVIGQTLDIEVTELLNNPFLEATTSEKYATIFYTWLIYLKLLIVPFPLTHDYYPYAIGLKTFSNPLVLLSLAIHIAAIFITVKQLFKFIIKGQKPNLTAYGILFYLLVFSISSNLIVNIGAFMNERFIYIANIGLFIIISMIITKFSTKFPNRKTIILTSFASVILIFSFLTINRNQDWKDDITLFTTDAQTSWNSAKCTVSAGGKTYEKALEEKTKNKKQKLLFEAYRYAKQGITIHPKYFQGWMILGNINYELSRYDETLLCYENCLRLAPGNQDVLNNLRNLAIKSRENDMISVSDKALKLLTINLYKPANTLYLKAYNLEKKGKIDSAIVTLQQVIKMDSTNSDAYNKMGQIIGQYKNDLETSKLYLLKSLELNPLNSSTLENLGTLYAIQADLSKALYYFKESHKVNPSNKQIYSNIANVYKSLGNEDEATNWIKKAEMLN